MKNWKVVKRDGQAGIVLGEVDREEHELPASAFGAKVEHDKDDRVVSVEFPEERFLPFDKAGKNVGYKRLYTVKAEKTDGSVIQVPLEDQINNNVASPENAIGLQFYARRGVNLLFDFESGEAAFCPTWDCWAQWNKEFGGFCCAAHKEITKPDNEGGSFGQGATTSRNFVR